MVRLTVLDNPWIPDEIKDGLTPKQTRFLAYEGREALFGGAAGGGKSVAILLAALQYAEEPGYAALILRRTYKQLAKADSILTKAKDWLLPLAPRVKWNGDDHKFTFPSGATIEFGHMEREESKYNYQGGAWAFCGVDEATQFTEPMLAYPRTRLRRPAGSLMPIRWRGASNPGGVGHDYVKARYVKDDRGRDPTTEDRRFFRATIADNPHVDRADYATQLRDSGVDPLTLSQLLEGDWDAIAGGRFRKTWIKRYTLSGHPGAEEISAEGRPVVALSRCLLFATADVAASVRDTADYTVISIWAVTPNHDLVWLDMVRGRWEVPDIVPRMRRAYAGWGLDYIAIESGGTQQGVYQIARRTEMAVRELQPGREDKLVRATAAIVLAESGRLLLPRGAPWLADAESELLRFTGDPGLDAHDDIVDTLAYAARQMKVKRAGPAPVPRIIEAKGGAHALGR